MLEGRDRGLGLQGDFMDKPDAESIVSALKTLFLLGALDNTKSLTPLGRQMAAFPLEPPLARALIASAELGCTSEVLTILSVLSASSKLFVDTHDARDEAADARKKFRHPSGDHLTVLNVVRAYEDVSRDDTKKGRKEWSSTSAPETLPVPHFILFTGSAHIEVSYDDAIDEEQWQVITKIDMHHNCTYPCVPPRDVKR